MPDEHETMVHADSYQVGYKAGLAAALEACNRVRLKADDLGCDDAVAGADECWEAIWQLTKGDA